MKKSISFFLFVFSFFTLISECAAASNARTLKVTLFTVGTFSKAKKFAENYGLKILAENDEWGKTDLVAYNEKTGEGVSYSYKYLKSAKRIVEFCYYNIGNKSESEIRFYEDEGTLMLKNIDKFMTLSSDTHWMPINMYQKFTDILAIQREVVKADLTSSYGIEFFDKINPNQPIVRMEKTEKGYNLFLEKHTTSTEK